jgi:hypothetical protein
LKKYLLIFLITFGVMAGLVLWLSKPVLPVAEPVPNPNGYNDILAAGQVLGTSDVPDFNTGTLEEFRLYVSSHHEELNRALVGLSKECRVPTEYSDSYISRHVDDLVAIKGIALAWKAEGKLAELENRPAQAAASLAAIKLGSAVSRGGLLMDGLFATACETFGTQPLMNLISKLSAEESRLVIQELEACERNKESFSAIRERERTFCRSQVQVNGLLWQLFQIVFGNKSLHIAMQKAENKYEGQRRAVLQTKVSLASHLFELERARKPKNFDDLVPRYLKHIPIDPQTRTNLAYPF